MAALPLGDRVRKLERVAATLLKEVEVVKESLRAAAADDRLMADRLSDLRRETEKAVLGLAKDFDELRRTSERNDTADLKNEVGVLKEKLAKLESAQADRGARKWSLMTILFEVSLSGAVAALVAGLVSAR